ncbi:sugar phosphorylase [Candidatus Chlorohelix sp.]|uniref:sugar phosphorylase n=1 Tax=Candidatus Chlorohelix sp. TaxID=3139201 RepID=UPI003073273A
MVGNGQIKQKLEFIYGEQLGQATFDTLEKLLLKYAFLKERPAKPIGRFSEKDAILITYGDQVQQEGQHPLATLHQFLIGHLKGSINSVHILPFYPYTSDDGFSVVDYRQVDAHLGDWGAIEAIEGDFKLMFDAVINHISAGSAWFQGFLKGESPYRDYFLITDPQLDLSGVTRPRTLPLLTAFETANGRQHVWTTFSADQIDLNFGNPQLLLDITELLLFYVSKGASLIRLDAIGYLWKEVGTNCIHLTQTHAVVQLWRAVLNELAPDTLLVTETNVPHRDNIGYFGDGYNEAQMVYQFPLVPLTLHTLLTGDSSKLRQWARELAAPSTQTTFFNFLASHDGIGVVPAKGILSDAEIENLVAATLRHGGQVSYKNNPDGSQSPYELNITYFDALSNPAEGEEIKIKRFMASQAILLSFQGMPGIYFHSLFGSPSWQEGFAQTGRARTLNRQKLKLPELEVALADSLTREARIFEAYSELLRLRAAHVAFHPNAAQEILETSPGIFALRRIAPDSSERILCLLNVTNQMQTLDSLASIITVDYGHAYLDLLSGVKYRGDETVRLGGYQLMWLQD